MILSFFMIWLVDVKHLNYKFNQYEYILTT